MTPDCRLLWPDGAPSAQGTTPLDMPALSIHLPEKSVATGLGIVVCPGGGYRILASDHEGRQVAQALNQIGIAAFVLRYRVGPTYPSIISIADGRRAIQHVRHYAAEYGVTRLGMLGFSAGGHLATAVGTQSYIGEEAVDDAVDQQSSVPDFLVPVYAVTNGHVRGRKADEYHATDTQVDEATPPTFLVHTHEDNIVPPEQSIIFYNALRAAGVQAELHVFGHGEHGVGLGVGDPDVREWFPLMHRWLRRMGFLTNKPRVAISGRALLDSQPMGLAWITFDPVDSNCPVARLKFNASTEGRFQLDQNHGPTQGAHRLVVSLISRKYPDNAMGDYTVENTLTYQTEINIQPDETIEIDLTREDFSVKDEHA